MAWRHVPRSPPNLLAPARSAHAIGAEVHRARDTVPSRSLAIAERKTAGEKRYRGSRHIGPLDTPDSLAGFVMRRSSAHAWRVHAAASPGRHRLQRQRPSSPLEHHMVAAERPTAEELLQTTIHVFWISASSVVTATRVADGGNAAQRRENFVSILLVLREIAAEERRDHRQHLRRRRRHHGGQM